jgi:(2Fe-2S) ferredoxin
MQNRTTQIQVCNGKNCRQKQHHKILTSLKNEVIYRGLESKVIVSLAKCIDHCENACVVTVIDENQTIYKHVTSDIARDIVNQHVINQQILKEHISKKKKTSYVWKLKKKIKGYFRLD